jgi:hypothetical protein
MGNRTPPPPRDLLDGALMAACKASIPGLINYLFIYLFYLSMQRFN